MSAKVTKKSSRTKKKASKKTTVNYTINVVGLILIFISLMADFKFGMLGRFLANIYRVIGGNTFQILALLTAIFGISLFAFSRMPKWGLKRYLGICLLISSCLTLMHVQLFQKITLNNDVTMISWRLLLEDLANNQVASDVGGGMIGAFLYSIYKPLFSLPGTIIINGVLAIIGILLLFDVRLAQVINIFHWLLIQCHNFVVLLQNKWQQRETTKKSSRSKHAKVPKTEADPIIATKEMKKVDDFTIEGPKDTPHKNVKRPSLASSTESAKVNDNYQLPTLDLLTPVDSNDQSSEYQLIEQNRKKLKTTLDSFGVPVEVKKATLGPTITKYEIQPAVGVKVSKIVNLTDDLALALAAKDIRIEAPIPGKPYVGIEVPNQHPVIVSFHSIIANEPPHTHQKLAIPIGKDVYGQIAMCDIAKLPHLLIAGSTGSGKSVAINTIITGILMQAHPEEVKMILIDPKMVELSIYDGIPHLLIPVVTDAKKANNALQKAVQEMERRYELFQQHGYRKIEEYNDAAQQSDIEPLPYIIIVIDELSDLMMVAGRDVENSIVRLAQKARAAGMHLIIATQRPSVDVITGLIKANIPSRMAFAVSSSIDSRTILDATGAEKLLGRGDMLFEPIGQSKPQRIQGAYISSQEVERVVEFVSKQQHVKYDEQLIPQDSAEQDDKQQTPNDEYWNDAVNLVAHEQKASASMLQRRFQIGYNRAARLIDDMEERGIIGPARGAKPRKVLVERPEIEDIRQDD
ncbi:FtsK/SpoIIIE family DNA translocase [Bombilactobacillus thymidiniphilus]|uniref:DNA translocase FtsK n=1 Tax=Bombilactobacillus thymidiniphilus TaxID=2923363 RepID=A0ABY4PCP8_9LACO|nr:DNA translocase FtsK [Bombilactobacillus thymidiniphilus]UQS83296.1 DNA translocase FtsK [Bombilactobacillus thymidiniphilus]